MAPPAQGRRPPPGRRPLRRCTRARRLPRHGGQVTDDHQHAQEPELVEADQERQEQRRGQRRDRAPVQPFAHQVGGQEQRGQPGCDLDEVQVPGPQPRRDEAVERVAGRREGSRGRGQAPSSPQSVGRDGRERRRAGLPTSSARGRRGGRPAAASSAGRGCPPADWRGGCPGQAEGAPERQRAAADLGHGIGQPGVELGEDVAAHPRDRRNEPAAEPDRSGPHEQRDGPRRPGPGGRRPRNPRPSRQSHASVYSTYCWQRCPPSGRVLQPGGRANRRRPGGEEGRGGGQAGQPIRKRGGWAGSGRCRHAQRPAAGRCRRGNSQQAPVD